MKLNTLVPLYWQIKEKIKEEVKKGRWKPGERVYTEEEIEKVFGVSRITAVKALNELEREGYVLRKRGKGSIVIPREEEVRGKLVYLMMRTEGHIFHPLAESIMRNLNGDGYHPLAYDFENSNLEKRWKEILSFGGEALVINGLSVFPFHLLDKSLQELPFLVFVLNYENKEKKYRGGYVLSDYKEGGYLAVKHLLEQGHQKILFFTYPPQPQPYFYINSLLSGCQKAFREKGLDYRNSFLIEIDEPGKNEEKLTGILSGPDRPTAVFSFGDSRCKDIFAAARKLHLSIPEDLAVIGYYNSPWCEILHPTLTSISIREEEIGGEVARLIRESKEERVIIPPLLVERESTRR